MVIVADITCSGFHWGKITVARWGKITVAIHDSNVLAVTNARGFTTSYAYDALNRLVQTVNALGGLSTIVYDSVGNVLATIDELGRHTTMAYDAANRLITITDALNHVSTLVYDLAGNLVQAVDAMNFTTTMVYDARNMLVSVQSPNGGVNTTVYDAVGNVVNTIDALGNKTTIVFDALNRQTQTINALSGTTTTVYDAVGNTVNVIDPNGNKTTFVYDFLNHLIQRTDPLGHSSTMAYDQAGELISTTDRNGRVINNNYNADGWLTGQTWIAGGVTTNLLTLTYDAQGNELTAADFHGAYTMTYDALDRMVTEQEPFGLTLTMGYDAVGNRTLFQDSFGGATSFSYDSVNNLTSELFSANGQPSLRIDLTYNARNQLATETRYSDLGGTQKVGASAYGYDGDGNLTTLQQTGPTSNMLENYTYTYDLADRVSAEILNGSSTTYSYDKTNQVTGANNTTYGYDSNGNRTNTGYVTGPNNQLLSDGIWSYTYDAEGNLTQKVNIATGEKWTYGYDNLNHMITAQDATSGGTVLMQATYVYDVFGNRIEKDVWTQSSGSTTVTRYALDGQKDFADLTGSNGLQTRYVDGNGVDQLFARESGGAASWYLTDRLGSVRNLTDNTGTLQDTIAYDAFGNITSESNATVGGTHKRWPQSD